MKKWPALLIIFFLCFAFGGQVASRVVQAQENEASIFEKPELAAQIIDVTKTYQTQLEEYRRQEQAYILAKDQYFKLQTLVALEGELKATKAALKARDQVLITYLTLLRLELINSTGVALERKQQTLNLIEQE